MDGFSDNLVASPPKYAISFRIVGRWLLLAAIFLAPFFFFPITGSPVDINKFFLICLLVLAAGICFLGCVLEEQKIEYPRSLFTFSLLLFLFIQIVSSVFSISRSESFWGNLMAPDSLLSFLFCALVFFLFFFFFRREDILKVAMAMGAGVAVASLIGFFYEFGFFIFPWSFAKASSFNLSGSVIDWGILAAGVVAAITVSDSGGWRKTLALAIALGILVTVNDQFLWLLVAGFVTIIAALRFEPRKHFLFASFTIVLALFFGFVSPKLTIFGAGADARPGVSPTFAVAYGVLSGWRSLIGSGPATFALDYVGFRPASINTTPYWSTVFSQGHDFASTILATTGILGFLSLLLIILMALRPLIRIELFDMDLAMASAAAAWFLVALFFYPAFFTQFIFVFALLGLLHADSGRRMISFQHLSRNASFAASFLLMLIAAGILAGLFVAGERYAAVVLDAQADNLAATGDLNDAFAKINQALGLDRSDVYLRDASGILIGEARVIAASSNGNLDDLPIVTTNAISAAQEATVINPRDPENWANLGSMYEIAMPLASGADALAEANYQHAISLDPSNPTWDLDLARTLIESANLLPAGSANDAVRQSEWSSAENFLNQAIALKSDYADPRIILAQLYLEEGNIGQAIEKVQELAQENPLDPGAAFELGYLYYQDNQFDQAQQEFQIATILDPNYSNARYYLGLIYATNGATAQALDEFKKIQALNPGNAQIESIITNLQAGHPALANIGGSNAPLESQAPAQIITSTSTSVVKSAPKRK